VDKEIRDIIQNRPNGLSVGDIHYSRVLERADEAYKTTILPFLEEKLGLDGGG
jgi:intergrase/recombinase